MTSRCLYTNSTLVISADTSKSVPELETSRCMAKKRKRSGDEDDTSAPTTKRCHVNDTESTAFE